MEGVDQLRRAVSLAETAARFGVKLVKGGREWIACCPFHVEKTASFTIFTGKDRVERFHCFGCQERGDVLDFTQKIKGVDLKEAINILGGRSSKPNVAPRQVEVADIYAGFTSLAPPREIEDGERVKLYNPKRAGTEREWGAFVQSLIHPYRNRDGVLLGYVLRHDLSGGEKETPMVMWVRRPDGGEGWCRFPFPKPRPLYGLDKLRDGQVFVVEGEKCRDRFAKASGRDTLAWAGGTYGINHTDWSPLAGRDVITWPDADGPGVKTAHQIAAIVADLGGRPRVLDVPAGGEGDKASYSFSAWEAGEKAPKGWDAADAIGAGWSKADLDAFMRATVKTWVAPPPAEKSAPVTPVQVAPAPVAADPRPADGPALVMDLIPSSGGRPVHDPSWTIHLVTNADGKTLPNATKNWTLFLENLPETAGMLAYDEFAGEAMLISRPPWDGGNGEWKPRPVQDHDIAEAVEWLEARHLTPKISTLDPVMEKIARRHPYHPVKNYFNSLPEWDGAPRLDTFLLRYLGADDTALNRAFGRKWLCAIAWRVFVPGCKFDTALVLHSPQGMRKSSFGRALVPIESWVTESVNVGDKAREVIENTSGVLIAELAELAGKSAREIETIKKFMTVQFDKARGAYRRRADTVSRQFVFYGTTNEKTFLTDATGNRRWWPVAPRMIDLDAIRADRDQIWAEVMRSWRDEQIWIDEDSDLGRQLSALNETKTDFGPTFDLICDLVPDGNMLVEPEEMRKLITAGSADMTKLPPTWRRDLHRALRGLGFEVPAQVARWRGGTSDPCRAYVRGDIGGRDGRRIPAAVSPSTRITTTRVFRQAMTE